MRITIVLGAEGAPFAHELAAALDPADELTVIAPTVRDHWSVWLKACPDLDALLTAPGGVATFGVADQLRAIDYSPSWQRASDQTVAARLVRTELLGTGCSLTTATEAAAVRARLPFRLLPMSDDRAELHVVVGEGASAHAVHVSEYLAAPEQHAVTETVLVAESWAVSPAVTDALLTADVLVLGPSSRTLAVDPVLRTPGLLDALPAALPVLVVSHPDTAPTDLVRVAGLAQPDPGRAEPVDADPQAVLTRARQLVAG